MVPTKRNRIETFRADGLFIVPRFIEERERVALRAACDEVLARVRAEGASSGHTTPRISLLENELGTGVASFFGSPNVCALLAGVALPGETAVPRLDDVHYYHEQTKHDWDGDWHRDSQFVTHDPERERALIVTTTRVHVRVALEDDDYLELVLGSHARWDTPSELAARKGSTRSGSFPATRVALRAGDACVFHAWSIHRATYRCAPVRRTLDAVFTFTLPPRSWRDA